EAARAHLLETSRPYEEETVHCRAGAAYRSSYVGDGEGTLFLLPDPRSSQGQVIKFTAYRDTESPYTAFTLVPGANGTLDGDAEAKRFQGRQLRIEVTAQEDDWAITSKSEEAP